MRGASPLLWRDRMRGESPPYLQRESLGGRGSPTSRQDSSPLYRERQQANSLLLEREGRQQDNHRWSPPRNRLTKERDYPTVRSRNHDDNPQSSVEPRSRSLLGERGMMRSPTPRETPPPRSILTARALASDALGDFRRTYETEVLPRESRSDMFKSRFDSSLFSDAEERSRGDVSVSQVDETYLNSYGMLVPRSIVHEDGTVQTFYALAPDPLVGSLPSTMNTVILGKDPPFPVDANQSYGAELSDLEAYRIGISSREDVIHGRRLADGAIIGHSGNIIDTSKVERAYAVNHQRELILDPEHLGKERIGFLPSSSISFGDNTMDVGINGLNFTGHQRQYDLLRVQDKLPWDLLTGDNSDVYKRESSSLQASDHREARRGRSSSPLLLRRDSEMDRYELDRSLWKRKHPEVVRNLLGEEIPTPPLETEFKRRLRPEDALSDRDLYDRSSLRWEGAVEYSKAWQERDDDEFNHVKLYQRPVVDFEEDTMQDSYNDLNGLLGFRHMPRSSLIGGGDLANNRSRPVQNSDFHNGILQKDEQLYVLDMPEGSIEFKQQVHMAFMKYAKILNGDSEQRKKYEGQGQAGTLFCLACSRFSKPFLDTHSVVMHTCISQKLGLRAEHLGLCKAICTLMGWRAEVEPACGKSYQRIGAGEARANKEDLILWPPAVVVHNVFDGSITNDRNGVAQAMVRELLKDSRLSHDGIQISVGRRGTVIIKYVASLPCLNDAERLHQHFISTANGRDDWERVWTSWKAIKVQNSVEGPDLVQLNGGKNQRRRVLYGYLALAHDLEKVDLEFLQSCVVRSRKEIQSIASELLTRR